MRSHLITARYAGPTDFTGSRYIVKDVTAGTRSRVLSYDYSASNSRTAAIVAFIQREHGVTISTNDVQFHGEIGEATAHVVDLPSEEG